MADKNQDIEISIEEKEVNKEQEELKQEENKEEKMETEENIEQLKQEINQLKEKLQKTEEQAKKLSILYQTLSQDFESYKLRTLKEKEQIKEETIEKLAKELLNIVDNFEKAIESAKLSDDISSLAKGVQMIHYQLVKFLENIGINEVIAEGEFNPSHHEAIDTYISTEHKPNEIVKVLQKGYKYKEKVIRPAKVVVAIPPEEKEEQEKNK
ncbi:nucleotide exchange factor GrpE [Hydrogenothermus marinus]|uniref:Protein GrpE n=1 Tax=Hydrogenothermus marinus TaxID=133270 RepID=A0A3M0B6S8_9AQUI|nr:nucleotide exchange factor GrpE [Hydrogenothermus marinus]RMA93110.1 molecular chaperone GrpE [Hydrogenothermus marinus]